MTIADRNALIAALVAAQPKRIFKPSATAEGASTFQSLWKVAGYPAAGANPPLFSAGAGYVPTSATLGALPFTNSSGANTLHLLLAALSATQSGTLIVYDRLWACSGFGTVVTTAQNVVTPGTLPAGRDIYTGDDVHPFLEVYTAPGSTTATWTLTGTDSAGAASKTWVYTHPANAETVGQMMPMLPGGASPGSMGMRVPTSFQCSASSSTAGDVGLTLMRAVATIPLEAASRAEVMDAIRLGFPAIQDDACLAFMVQCSTTATGQIMGSMMLGEG